MRVAGRYGHTHRARHPRNRHDRTAYRRSGRRTSRGHLFDRLQSGHQGTQERRGPGSELMKGRDVVDTLLVPEEPHVVAEVRARATRPD